MVAHPTKKVDNQLFEYLSSVKYHESINEIIYILKKKFYRTPVMLILKFNDDIYKISNKGKDQPIICNVCRVIYPKLNWIKRHFWKNHPEYCYRCKLCNKHFTGYPDYRNHNIYSNMRFSFASF